MDGQTRYGLNALALAAMTCFARPSLFSHEVGANTSSTGATGLTALHVAAVHGCPDEAHVLLTTGADAKYWDIRRRRKNPCVAYSWQRTLVYHTRHQQRVVLLDSTSHAIPVHAYLASSKLGHSRGHSDYCCDFLFVFYFVGQNKIIIILVVRRSSR